MFVEPYLRELRARRFTPLGFAVYIGKSTRFAIGRGHDNLEAVRSVLLTSLVFFVAFVAAAVALAQWHDGEIARRFITTQCTWLIVGCVWILAHIGLLRGDDGNRRTHIGLPNQLSYLRLVLIPSIYVFIVEGALTLATVAYAVAGLTDVLDGFLARRMGLTSRLGLVLDPIVDVGYIIAIFAGFHATDAVPGWLYAIVLARYILLFGGYTVVQLGWGQVNIQPTAYGRASGLVTTGINFVLLALVGTGSLTSDPGVRDVLMVGLGFLFSVGILQMIAIGFHNVRRASDETAR